jgi:general secretion pathway protein H
MRISATGNSGPRARCFHPRAGGDPWAPACGVPRKVILCGGPCAGALSRKCESGFTLVELLIVLTIIGLMSAAVMIAMPDPRGSLVAEAERFAARAKAAQDRAVIGSRPMAVRVTSAGYGFDRRRQREWEAMSTEPFVDYRWRDGVQAEVGGSGATRIVFDPTGIADPATVTLRSEGDQVQITIAQDGRIDVAG